MWLGLVTRLNPTIKDEYELDGCENRNNEDVDDIRDEIKILQQGLMLERLEFICVILLSTESLFITSKYDKQRLKLEKEFAPKMNRTIEMAKRLIDEMRYEMLMVAAWRTRLVL